MATLFLVVVTVFTVAFVTVTGVEIYQYLIGKE